MANYTQLHTPRARTHTHTHHRRHHRHPLTLACELQCSYQITVVTCVISIWHRIFLKTSFFSVRISFIYIYIYILLGCSLCAVISRDVYIGANHLRIFVFTGGVLISNKTSDRKISRSFQAARLVGWIIVSLRRLGPWMNYFPPVWWSTLGFVFFKMTVGV